MNMRRGARRIVSVALACAVLSATGAFAGGELVIANEGVAVMGLSRAAVSNLFTGKTQMLPSGETAVLATLKDGPAHHDFLATFLGTTPQDFLSNWRKLVFTGKAKMPVQFATEQELVEFVAKTKGAIGYVSPGAARSGVKVIKVQE